MNAKDAIIGQLETAHMLVTTYISDFTDADLLERAMPGCHHAAWQLGHVITAEHEMMKSVGVDMPALPDGFAEAYSTEAAASDDAAKFHTKGQYLATFDGQRAATLTALGDLPEADLDKAAPEAMQAYAPTVGAVFNMVGVHATMHAAQWVPLRRKLDKPILI